MRLLTKAYTSVFTASGVLTLAYHMSDMTKLWSHGTSGLISGVLKLTHSFHDFRVNFRSPEINPLVPWLHSSGPPWRYGVVGPQMPDFLQSANYWGASFSHCTSFSGLFLNSKLKEERKFLNITLRRIFLFWRKMNEAKQNNNKIVKIQHTEQTKTESKLK